jgi:hypothetical protein
VGASPSARDDVHAVVAVHEADEADHVLVGHLQTGAAGAGHDEPRGRHDERDPGVGDQAPAPDDASRDTCQWYQTGRKRRSTTARMRETSCERRAPASAGSPATRRSNR